MQVYIKAKSKKDINTRLEAGVTVYASQIDLYGSEGEADHLHNLGYRFLSSVHQRNAATMSKILRGTPNEAVGNITNNLARHYYKSPGHRARLRKWLDDLEKPVTYSNEDIDRASQFHDFLIELADDTRLRP